MTGMKDRTLSSIMAKKRRLEVEQDTVLYFYRAMTWLD